MRGNRIVRPRFEGSFESFFQEFNPMDQGNFDEVAARYARIFEPYLPTNPESSILDLGCGPGHFLYFLRRAGFENHLGVDASREFVEFVAEHITPKVVQQDVFAFLSECEITYDIIVVNDFIEHLEKQRVRTFLKAVERICSPRGRLLVKTINMSYPLAARSLYSDPTHELGFTEESIAYMLREAGFESVKLLPAEPAGVNVLLRLLLFPLYRIAGRRIPRVVTPDIVAVAGKPPMRTIAD